MGNQIVTKTDDTLATPPGHRNDEWTLLLVKVGKERCKTAFAQLFNHFAPIMKGYCLSNSQFSLPAELADELIQDVMLKVWSKAPKFDASKAAASTWIFTVMRNSRIDLLRKQQKHSAQCDPLEVDDIWDETLDHQPVVRLEQARDRDRLLRNMEALPLEQKEALQQVYIQGKSHNEIALDTGLPLGTVKSRVRIGLKKLQAALSGR